MTAASITCTELTVRFPVYGADAKSLKKALARAVAVGGAWAATPASPTSPPWRA